MNFLETDTTTPSAIDLTILLSHAKRNIKIAEGLPELDACHTRLSQTVFDEFFLLKDGSMVREYDVAMFNFWRFKENLSEEVNWFLKGISITTKSIPNIDMLAVKYMPGMYVPTYREVVAKHPELSSANYVQSNLRCFSSFGYPAFLGGVIPLYILRQFLTHDNCPSHQREKGTFDLDDVESFITHYYFISAYMHSLPQRIIMDAGAIWYMSAFMQPVYKANFLAAVLQSMTFAAFMETELNDVFVKKLRTNHQLKEYITETILDLAKQNLIFRTPDLIKTLTRMGLKHELKYIPEATPILQEIDVNFDMSIFDSEQYAVLLSQIESENDFMKTSIASPDTNSYFEVVDIVRNQRHDEIIASLETGEEHEINTYDFSDVLNFDAQNPSFSAALQAHLSRMREDYPALATKKDVLSVALAKKDTPTMQSTLAAEANSSKRDYVFKYESHLEVFAIENFTNAIVPCTILLHFMDYFRTHMEDANISAITKQFIAEFDTTLTMLASIHSRADCYAMIWSTMCDYDTNVKLKFYSIAFNTPAFFAMYFGPNNQAFYEWAKSETGFADMVKPILDLLSTARLLKPSAGLQRFINAHQLKIDPPVPEWKAPLPPVITYDPAIHGFLSKADFLSVEEKTALNDKYKACVTKNSIKLNPFFDMILNHANAKLAPEFAAHVKKSGEVIFADFAKKYAARLKEQAAEVQKAKATAPSTSKDKQKAEDRSAQPDDATRLKKEAEEAEKAEQQRKKAEEEKRKQEEKRLKKEQEELLKTQKKQAEEAQKAAEKAAKEKAQAEATAKKEAEKAVKEKAQAEAKAKKEAEKQAKAKEKEKEKASEASTSAATSSHTNKSLFDSATQLGRKIVDKITPNGVRKKVEKAVYSHATQMFFKLGRPLQLNHATGSVTSLSPNQAPPAGPIPAVADASSWPLPQASRAEVVSPVVSPKLAPPVEMQPTLAEQAPLPAAPHQAPPETPWQAPDNALETLFNLVENGADKEAILDIFEHDNVCSDLFNGLASASFETLERYSVRISQFFESDKVRHSWKSRLWDALLVQCDTPVGCYLAALICKQNGFYDLANIYYHLAGGKHYHKGQQDLKALCLPADSIAMGFETTNRKATQEFLDALLLGYGDRLKGMRVALTAANQSSALHPHDYLQCLNIYVVYLIKMLRTGAFEVGQYTHLYPAFARNRDGLLQTCKECVDDIFMNLGHNQTILMQYAEPAWILFQNLNILSQDVYGQSQPDIFLYNGIMENTYPDQGMFFRNMSYIAASTEVNGDAHRFGEILQKSMYALKT